MAILGFSYILYPMVFGHLFMSFISLLSLNLPHFSFLYLFHLHFPLNGLLPPKRLRNRSYLYDIVGLPFLSLFLILRPHCFFGSLCALYCFFVDFVQSLLFFGGLGHECVYLDLYIGSL